MASFMSVRSVPRHLEGLFDDILENPGADVADIIGNLDVSPPRALARAFSLAEELKGNQISPRVKTYVLKTMRLFEAKVSEISREPRRTREAQFILTKLSTSGSWRNVEKAFIAMDKMLMEDEEEDEMPFPPGFPRPHRQQRQPKAEVSAEALLEITDIYHVVTRAIADVVKEANNIVELKAEAPKLLSAARSRLLLRLGLIAAIAVAEFSIPMELVSNTVSRFGNPTEGAGALENPSPSALEQ